MDKKLLAKFDDAIKARPLIDQLPTGLREHAQQFEKLCLDDIRTQAGNPNLNEQEILDLIRPTLTDIVKQALPIIADITMSAIKKHYPAVTTATVLSALINHLAAMLQK